jgi:hypothetical protein
MLRNPSHLTATIADIETRKQKAAEYNLIRDCIMRLRSERRNYVTVERLTDAPVPPEDNEEENIHTFGTVMDFARETNNGWDRRLDAIRRTLKHVVEEFNDFVIWRLSRRHRLRQEYAQIFNAGPWC